MKLKRTTQITDYTFRLMIFSTMALAITFFYGSRNMQLLNIGISITLFIAFILSYIRDPNEYVGWDDPLFPEF